MTDAELDAIEARAKAATPGPWTAEHEYIAAPVPGGRPNGEVIGDFIPSTRSRHVPVQQMRANATFVAAARDDVPALVAEVRRLTAAWEGQR
jgi:hypothetical protein